MPPSMEPEGPENRSPWGLRAQKTSLHGSRGSKKPLSTVPKGPDSLPPWILKAQRTSLRRSKDPYQPGQCVWGPSQWAMEPLHYLTCKTQQNRKHQEQQQGRGAVALFLHRVPQGGGRHLFDIVDKCERSLTLTIPHNSNLQDRTAPRNSRKKQRHYQLHSTNVHIIMKRRQ